MDITFDKISGALGSLLLVWGRLEKSVREEVIRVHGDLPKTAHGIAAVLRTWESMVIESQSVTSLGPSLATALRGQLQMPLAIRNGLCHGLVGISAASEQMPATLAWEINNQKHSICWDDLQAQFRWLSRLPHAVFLISNPGCGNRHTNTAENREWWRLNYSLDLTEP